MPKHALQKAILGHGPALSRLPILLFRAMFKGSNFKHMQIHRVVLLWLYASSLQSGAECIWLYVLVPSWVCSGSESLVHFVCYHDLCLMLRMIGWQLTPLLSPPASLDVGGTTGNKQSPPLPIT